MPKQVSVTKSTDPFYYKHRKFFVGIFVLIPLLVIPALLIFALIQSEMLAKWVELNLKCETGMGLKKGTEVNIIGKKVGHVHSVTLNKNGYVDVAIRIKDRYKEFVRKDSRAWLKQKHFVVGDWEIDLTMGNKDSSDVIENGDTLEVVYQIRLEKMVEVVTEMITPLEKIIESLEKGEGLIKYIFGEDTLMSDVHAILGRVNNLFTEVNRTLYNANQMIDHLAAFGSHGTATVDSLMVFSQHADQLIADMGFVVLDLDSLISDFGLLPENVDTVLYLLQEDLREAEILLKGIQNHWFFRRAIRKQRERDERELKKK